MKKSISLLLILTLVLSMFGGMTAFATEGEVLESVTEETTAEAPIEETAEELSEIPTEAPVEELGEAPAEELAEELIEKPVEEITEAPIEESVEAPVEGAAEEALEEVAEEPTSGDSESSAYTQVTAFNDAAAVGSGFVVGTVDSSNSLLALLNNDGTAQVDDAKTVTGTKGAYVLAGANPRTVITATETDKGGGRIRYTLLINKQYAYVDSTGALKFASDSTGLDNWGFKNNQLYYEIGSTKYYAVATWPTAFSSSGTPLELVLLNGTGSDSKGGGDSQEETTTVDEYAPVIVKQPANPSTTGKTTVTFEVEATAYTNFATDLTDATTYQKIEYKETLNTDGDADVDAADFPLTYQWYSSTDGGDNWVLMEGETGTSVTVTVPGATEYGLYGYKCEVTQSLPTFTETGVSETFTDHTTTTIPAGFIINAGTVANSLIMMSDIHGHFEAISDSIKVFMLNNDNKIPELIIASGDYTTSHPDEAGTTALLDTVMGRTFGLTTLLLAGNHDKSQAVVDYSKNELCDNSKDFDGCGVLYETANLIVYGINYELQTAVNTGYGTLSDDGVTKEVDDWLKHLTEGQQKKMIIFVAHAGLHLVKDTFSDASYNLNNMTDMVDVLNYYGQTLNIGFFFGHNHSRQESEFFVGPGETITCVKNYDSNDCETRTINFTYGQIGFIQNYSHFTAVNYGSNADDKRVLELARYAYANTKSESEPVDTQDTKLNQTYDEVPSISALTDAKYEKDAKADKLEITVTWPDGKNHKGELAYQWYSNNSYLTKGGTLIEGANKKNFTPPTDKEGTFYYYCQVTPLSKDSNFISTSTCAKITVGDTTTPASDPLSSGEWAVVIKVDSKYYALSCAADGTLSAVEVTVENNLVVNPRTADLRWEISNPNGAGTVYNKTAGLYLIRTSGGGSKFSTTNDSTNKYTSWTYDGTLHMLYSAASSGTTRYFYPAYSSNALKLADTTSLSGDMGVYLMKFKADASTTTPANAPAKDAKKGPIADTGDDSTLGLWISLAAFSVLASGYVLTMKKKHN